MPLFSLKQARFVLRAFEKVSRELVSSVRSFWHEGHRDNHHVFLAGQDATVQALSLAESFGQAYRCQRDGLVSHFGCCYFEREPCADDE